ncbi:MAG: alpha/beta fold hydrolase [Pseudomonadota bacterium]|nr:alpha/beta fold hydrolase [Pseudomonadota bacterium]
MKLYAIAVTMLAGLVPLCCNADVPGARTREGIVKSHQGRWLGDMTLPDGKTLKIGAELLMRADGSAWASFASPDQAAYDIPVKTVTETPRGVTLDIGFATLAMTWSHDHFEGAYAQQGPPLSVVLHKVAEFPRRLLPQAPRAPFPYRQQELVVASDDGVMLGATLSLPYGKTTPNVVVLVAGSGPVARDGGVAGHQGFLVMADYLARRGIAVLRYDKRGVARSTGSYDQHTIAQLGDDLHAVLKSLRASKRFGRIGVIGVSEGPGLAASVAARDPAALDFVVSLAGVGVNGLELLLLQDRIYAKDRGATPPELDRLMPYVRNYYGSIIEHAAVGPRIAALRKLFESLAIDDQALVRKYEMNQGTLSLEWAAEPALRASLLSNPPADWRAVKSPVLVLNGDLDHQVPADENQGGILAALRAGGNQHVESARLPSVNHMLQTATTGADDEYFRIEETIAPAILERVAAFVLKQK